MAITWLRRSFLTSLVLVVVAFLLFSYVLWLSPAARTGRHNQQRSYLVRPGMALPQALQILGQPQKSIQDESDIVFVYPAHPFGAGDIYLRVGADKTVKSISHSE